MIRRRSVLQMLAATAVATQYPALHAVAAEKRRLPWRNWSGCQQCLPEDRIAPASIAQLQELVAGSTGVLGLRELALLPFHLLLLVDYLSPSITQSALVLINVSLFLLFSQCVVIGASHRH